MSFPGSFSGTIVGSYPGGGASFAEALPKELEEHGFVDFHYTEGDALTFTYPKYKFLDARFRVASVVTIAILQIGDQLSLQYKVNVGYSLGEYLAFFLFVLSASGISLVGLFHPAVRGHPTVRFVVTCIIVFFWQRRATLASRKREFDFWLRSVLQEVHDQAGEQRAT